MIVNIGKYITSSDRRGSLTWASANIWRRWSPLGSSRVVSLLIRATTGQIDGQQRDYYDWGYYD